MRNLTIKRKKSFVASLNKMKVYIEDSTSDEITINNVSCRKLGGIKNGEEQIFQISEQAAKVFVIADKLSKNFCNEFYQLSYGEEDVVLSGGNRFNLANGNAFRFDNNDNEEVIANRKKGARKGAVILAVAIVVGAVIGFLIGGSLFDYVQPDESLSNESQTSQTKTFSVEGMNIALTNEFNVMDMLSCTAAYESENVAVFALKEEFTLAEGFGDKTLEEYVGLICESNNFGELEVKTNDGLTYFEYDYANPETNENYRYFSYVYKTSDAFWLIQFATPETKIPEYETQITEWAKSVKFDG